MTFKKNIFLLISFLLIFTACYKDQGNYDLSEINAVSFEKMGSDSIFVNQFDTLKVETSLKQTMGSSTENLSYKWSVYLFTPPITGVINEVLATTKDLRVPFGLRPDKYTLLYTVTDNTTGVSFFKKYYLEVGSTLSEGWLMIAENNNAEREIHLLNPNGAAIKNIFGAANPGQKVPNGSHTVRVLTTFFGGSQNIFILGFDDATRVNYTNFTKVNSATDWYIEQPSKIRPQDFSYDNVGSNSFYMDNGNILSNQIDFRFGVPVEGDYIFSKYFLPSQSSDAAILYDIKNKRFMNYARKVITKFADSPSAAFDLNNVGMDPIFAGPAPSNQYSYLMTGSDNQPYVLRISNSAAISKTLVNKATKIMSASHAAFSSLYFHLYYAVNNELYLLDISNNSSKLVFSFPSSEKIGALQIKQSLSSFVSYPDNNRTIAVGTHDGTEGKVYVFAIDNVGEFVEKTYKTIYRNLDKPIFLTYKNKK